MTYSFSAFDTKTAASSASMIDNIFNSMQNSGNSKSKSDFDFDATFMSEFKENTVSSRTYDDSTVRDNKFFSADNRTSIQNNSNDEHIVKRQNDERHQTSRRDEGDDDSGEKDALKERAAEEHVEHEEAPKNEHVENKLAHDKSGEDQRENNIQERSQASSAKENSEKPVSYEKNSEKPVEEKRAVASSKEQHPLASVAGSKEFKAVLESLNLQAGILSASIRNSAKTEGAEQAEIVQAGSKAKAEKTTKKTSVSANAEQLTKQTQDSAGVSSEASAKEKSSIGKASAETVKKGSSDQDLLATLMAQHVKADTEHKRNSSPVAQTEAGTSQAKQSKSATTQTAAENKVVKNDDARAHAANSRNISQLENSDVKIQSVKIETVEAEKGKTQNAGQETEAGRLLKSLESKNPELNSKLLSRSASENGSHGNAHDKGLLNREGNSDSELKQELQNAVKTAVKDLAGSSGSAAQTQIKMPEINLGMQNNLSADAKIQAQNASHTQTANDGMPSNLKNITVVQEIMGRIQNTVKGSGYESGTKMTMDIQSGSLGNIQLSLQHSADSIKVSLQFGDDSAKDFLMNQRREMEQQLKDMGFNHVNVDVSSKEGDSRNQDRQLYNAMGNEDLENVKLSGDDKADLASLLATTI